MDTLVGVRVAGAAGRAPAAVASWERAPEADFVHVTSSDVPSLPVGTAVTPVGGNSGGAPTAAADHGPAPAAFSACTCTS